MLMPTDLLDQAYRSGPRELPKLAVAAVMAHDRAAILAGDRGRASTSDELPGNEQTAPGSPDTEAVRYPLALSPVPK
jgi:hypothetical protein